MKRRLHLNLFINSRGHHEASWRHPEASPLALTDIRYYQDLAQRAEAALFDSVFLADVLALGDDVAQVGRTWLEPITVLAAWNIVTSSLASSARNLGGEPQLSHADRYARGEEFMRVVNALWDSWAEDALIDDRASGIYAKADRIRPINHRGDFYQVEGPLNIPRCP